MAEVQEVDIQVVLAADGNQVVALQEVVIQLVTKDGPAVTKDGLVVIKDTQVVEVQVVIPVV